MTFSKRTLLQAAAGLELLGEVADPDQRLGHSAAPAVRRGASAAAAATPEAAVIDQRNSQFTPRVTVITTGTRVRFPNSDNVRHQVYSFSPAKRFELSR